MRSWQLAVSCLALLAMGGCRSGPAVALLEQENRDLEDQIFELADLVEDCRRENAKLRRRLGGLDGASGEPVGLSPPPGLTKPAQAPGPHLAHPSDFTPQLRSPTVEVPSQDIPAEEFLEKFSKPSPFVPSDRLPALPGQEAPKRGASGVSPEGVDPSDHPDLPEKGNVQQGSATTTHGASHRRADNTQVTAITLDDRLTGGYNLDGRGGHEGIIAVVEPRDAEGRPLDAPAPVSVVVLDPALSGDAARVARWDFTAEEIAKRYHRTPLSEGIHLEMVWPAALPVHSRLHLFVRYTTDDGRKLEADRPIEVDVPALQARLPLLTPPTKPATGSSKTATEWQRKPSPPIQRPAREAARTALVPAQRSSGASEPAKAPPQLSPPKRRLPVWSPDRM